MSPDSLTELAIGLGREAIWISLLISAPVLLAGMVVGLVIGLLQAVTQIQEQTVAFVPKIVIMVLVLSFTLPWLLSQMMHYTTELIRDPGIPKGGCLQAAAPSRQPPCSLALLNVDRFLVFTLVLTRISGLLMATPVMGAKEAPMTVRALVSLALAVLIMPSQWSVALPYPGGVLVYVVIIAAELIDRPGAGHGHHDHDRRHADGRRHDEPRRRTVALPKSSIPRPRPTCRCSRNSSAC